MCVIIPGAPETTKYTENVRFFVTGAPKTTKALRKQMLLSSRRSQNHKKKEQLKKTRVFKHLEQELRGAITGGRCGSYWGRFSPLRDGGASLLGSFLLPTLGERCKPIRAGGY